MFMPTAIQQSPSEEYATTEIDFLVHFHAKIEAGNSYFP